MKSPFSVISGPRWFRNFFLPVAGLCLLTASLFGAVRIGGWAFSANGQLARDYQYTGSCPVDLKFDWGVLGTEPGGVAYTFRRNDGAHTNQRTMNLPAANRSVPIIETWRLGANTPEFRNYRGWVELQIESPNPVTKRIDFTLHCR